MILQSLVHHYEYLTDQGELPPLGWSYVGVSYALGINDDGDLDQIIDIRQEIGEKRKKKIPHRLVLPAQVERTSNTNPSFLGENTGYLLGVRKEKVVNDKAKETIQACVNDKSRETFQACKELHEKILTSVNCPEAAAILKFFSKWNPEAYADHPVLKGLDPKFFNDGIVVFRYVGKFARIATKAEQPDLRFPHNIPEIQQAWMKYYESQQKDAIKGRCLITGKEGPLALTHPYIKGVVGSGMSGGKLVSFNNEISWSDGHESGENAPISTYAAFAYASALNYMLADRKHSFTIGDISVVCWAKDGGCEYQDSFLSALRGKETYTTSELQDMTGEVCKAKTVSFDRSKLDENCTFYVLGLSSSKSRISVRFFFQNSFGYLLENVRKHQARLQIDSPSFANPAEMSLWRLLMETKPKSKKKGGGGGSDGEKKDKPTAEDSLMYNDVMMSIMNNRRYPESLCSAILNRIKAEKTVTPGKVAILKAYFLKSPHYNVPKSILGETLNPDSKNVPYNLGRIFSVLETIQWYYNPDSKDTVKNRFFDGAAMYPAVIYPQMFDLSECHLNRLPEKKQYWLRGMLSEIKKKAGTKYPVFMTVQQQVAFYLGYYQQTQQRFHRNNNNTQNEEELQYE